MTEKVKIVMVSNYDSETFNERQLTTSYPDGSSVAPVIIGEYAAQRVCEILNAANGDGHHGYWVTKPKDYIPYEWQP